MKIKTSLPKQKKHTAAVICLSWCSNEEVISCGDDHKLIKWNSFSNEIIVLTTFDEDVFPMSMDLYPHLTKNNNKQSELLISTADGRFLIVTYSGKIEKSASAHQGACLFAQWSPDGAGFLTAGEDGSIKIWSKSGLLRSTIVQSDLPIYSTTWSPDSSAILYSRGGSLILRNLNSATKTTKWKAHDDLVLCVCWNANNNLILSGGEDGFFKVWDNHGQLISSSVRHEHPITALSWSHSGDFYFVGSFNLIRLCSASGWSNCLDRPTTGTVNNLGWSQDGTQVAMVCVNGNVLFAHVVDRKYNWKNYSCFLTDWQTICLKNVLTNESDSFEYPERVVQIVFGYNQLVVATTKHCHIHPMNSWNTPVVCELKEGSVHLLLLSERCFCLVERTAVSIFSYNGRLLATPKWPNMMADALGKGSVALGPDSLAVIDQNDRKSIHIFELSTGLAVRNTSDQPSSKLSHKVAISALDISRTSQGERILAIIDVNKDLYIINLKDSKSVYSKLASQVLSICWSSCANILAGLRANSVIAWCCPLSTNQPDLLAQTTVIKEVSDLGRSPTIEDFEDGIVKICKSNGALLHISLVPFPEKLSRYVDGRQWKLALKLCRTVEDKTLWACLAALAWRLRELDVAEEAFAYNGAYHQLEYIDYLKSNEPERISSMEPH